MSMLMIQAKVKDDCVATVEAAATEMFAAIDKAQPKGVRYASTKLPDGATFVIFLDVDEGIENPLPAVPEFREFQQSLPGWLVEPATPQPLTVVGSYNLF